jgi:disulfide bond formation protein DsbB
MQLARRALADDILREPLWLAMTVLLVAGAAILAALGFEHIGGYQPCALCLMQRTPYYLGIPVAAGAVAAARLQAPRPWLLALFGVLAALFLYNAGLAAYHAGVEWRFWEGPASCAPSVAIGSAADMLNQLETTRAPSCTDATWRLAGLSFAGWNVLISAALAGLALLGFRTALRGADYGSSTASQYR